MTTEVSKSCLKTIKRICRYLADSYTFGYYDREDIEQEAFIIALEALPRYNPEISSLDTFLFTHINNKLKTFKRDHYFRADFICRHCGRKDPNCDYCKRREWKHAAKKHLMEPIDIEHVNGDAEHNMYVDDTFIGDVELNELLLIINNELDVSLREDYLKMLDGVQIPRNKRVLIESQIISILEDHGYYHGK